MQVTPHVGPYPEIPKHPGHPTPPLIDAPVRVPAPVAWRDKSHSTSSLNAPLYNFRTTPAKIGSYVPECRRSAIANMQQDQPLLPHR